MRANPPRSQHRPPLSLRRPVPGPSPRTSFPSACPGCRLAETRSDQRLSMVGSHQDGNTADQHRPELANQRGQRGNQPVAQPERRAVLADVVVQVTRQPSPPVIDACLAHVVRKPVLYAGYIFNQSAVPTPTAGVDTGVVRVAALSAAPQRSPRRCPPTRGGEWPDVAAEQPRPRRRCAARGQPVLHRLLAR